MTKKENIFKKQVIYSQINPYWYVEVYDEDYNEVLLKSNFSSFTNSLNILTEKTDKKLRYMIEEQQDYLLFLNELLKLNKEKRENILGISFVLYDKLDSKKFELLFKVLHLFSNNINVEIKISSTNQITLTQLDKLLKLKHVKYTFKIDDELMQKCKCNAYENLDYYYGGSTENIYTIHEMILIKTKIDEILKSVSKETSSLNKAKYIAEYLISNTTYDYKMVKDIPHWYDVKDKGVYRVLFENFGVCECISQTFRILMLESGKECNIIRNDTHSWNEIKIDGKWYDVDLTFFINNKDNIRFVDKSLKESKNITFLKKKK